jgi:uncharacterized protein
MSSRFPEIKKSLPILGVGLGLRQELADETFEHANQIDWLEFVPENYMGLGGNSRRLFQRAKAEFPLISHGVNLSIGSTDELNYEYLQDLKEVLDQANCAWFSDHLCFSSTDGIYMHDLLPLPFSREAVSHIARRIKRVQDYIQRPFLLENISFYMNMPGNEMSDAQFLSEVLQAADCGLLLDVNNVYVNSVNHGFDPRQFLDELPLERTVQMHVAGHSRQKELIIDTHGAAVIQPVYELLEYVLSKVPVKAVMLERDQNFPDFAEILDELAVIRQIAAKVQPELLEISVSTTKELGNVPALSA